MGRPVLIDKSFLKPKIIVDPIVIDTPSISFNYFIPEMDNQSISILVNLAFFTILTFGALWIYHLYLDKLDTKITTVQELENQVYNQPLIINNGPIIPSNLTDVPEQYNYI